MTLDKALFAMGSRDPGQKAYLLLNPPPSSARGDSNKGNPLVLTMLHAGFGDGANGLTLQMDERKARTMLRDFLMDLRHPFVIPTRKCDFVPDKGKLLIFRDFVKRGSLKDLIHRGVEPVGRYATKYGAAREAYTAMFPGVTAAIDMFPCRYGGHSAALPEKRCQILGRQILEGLLYLEQCGVKTEGIHSANVLMLRSDHCVLSDFEVCSLGMSPLKDFCKDGAVKGASPSVLLFGHILHEMATGKELPTNALKVIIYQLLVTVSPCTCELYGGGRLPRVTPPHR